MITRLRSWLRLVPSLPDLLFPTIPVAAARRAAMIPVLGTLAACWGAGFIRYGKSPIAAFVATLLVALGISLLAGVRALARAIARTAADSGSSSGSGDDLWVIIAIPVGAIGVALLAGAGTGVMYVMTAGTLGSPTAPGLNFPAQMGIWLWLAHEVYYGRWTYLHQRDARQAEPSQP